MDVLPVAMARLCFQFCSTLRKQQQKLIAIMAYLKRIQSERLSHLRDLDIDLEPAPERDFRHLVLTGPNGSGKTTLLNAIAGACLTNAHGDFGSRKSYEVQMDNLVKQLNDRISVSNKEVIKYRIEELKSQIKSEQQQRPVQVSWTTSDSAGIRKDFETGNSVLFHAPAQRQLGINAVTGPQKFSLTPTHILSSHPSIGNNGGLVAGYVLQLLVNKKTERTFASEDKDLAVVERIDAWLENIRQSFGTLLEAPDLKMRFDRNAWDYTFVRPRDGREFNMHGLSHGHASAIQIFSELLVRFETSQQARNDPLFIPQGLAIIDEIETHLHLRLQETILPFLTKAFPTIQFIVATHSPSVVASIPNAVIFDLEKQKAEHSEDLQGVRYGDIATGHFGIQSDYDVDTREKLEELDFLFEKFQRTEEEESRMRLLAGELATKSHNLALEVLLRLRAKELAESNSAAEGGND